MNKDKFLNKLSKHQNDLIEMYESLRGEVDMDVIQDFYLHAYNKINGDKVFTEEGFRYGYIKQSLKNFIIDKYRHDNSNRKIKINYNVEILEMKESIEEHELLDREERERQLAVYDEVKDNFSEEELKLVKLLISSKLSAHVKREFQKKTEHRQFESKDQESKLLWNDYMKQYHKAKKILNEMKSLAEQITPQI